MKKVRELGTRDDYVGVVMEIAQSFSDGDYSDEKLGELEDICFEWNYEHPDDEIFFEEEKYGITVERRFFPIESWCECEHC